MKIKITLFKSSAEIVASIDHLLTDILLRLPIKSLIRSKLVSKHWHFLITDPGFCILRNPNPNPAIGLFLPCNILRANVRLEYVPFSVNKSNNPPFRKLKFTKDPSGIRILQSCNGLLLCCSFQAHDYNRRYYVYNPTTNRFSKLPKLAPGDGITTNIRSMSLVFDPAKSPDHYKVVCVRGLELANGEWQYQIEIYSSETGPWRKRGEPFAAQVNFENGVYWNNAIHWISNNGNDDSLYFNLDNDQMVGIMPLPPIPDPEDWDWRSNYYFGESCDHLHYIEIIGPQIQFNVYEMKRDYSEWFVKYHVDLSHVVAANPGMIRDNYDPTDWYYYAFSIFCLVRGEEEEDSFLVLQIPGKVIRYNLVYKTFEIVHEFEGAQSEGYLRFASTNGFQYIESLCCV
ncbi:hypothetical protein BUALT_Bualt01G0062600 [Buddleja alternifolia]|uniref:F-box domain-containing protein n=1 Tax=Buddleja alternifolia TaxID=168488 RepID=A0AAV6Y5Y2_9LAMI|nr:hypothetical protein BUALT_Bualt01G0062600 [Buddleja alternifolia]